MAKPRPPRRGLTPTQFRYLAIAWLALTVIVGICAFAAFTWAFGGGALLGSGGAEAPPTPVAHAGPTPTPIATLPPATEPTQADKPGLPPLKPFELGGQAIHGGFPHADLMKAAGMTWVKLQAYDLSVDFGPAIDNAHNHGLRILVSLKDEANKERVNSPDYQQQFAAYAVTLAQQGADAIEVWNEANIDREWPTGQISGQAYTQLLALVYPQIKAANPETMVISGALSPTGFFGGGCSPNGCDDQPFLEDMVAAGALNYADCVGIHYNEGILPPSATSGDPRGNPNHYTRYYQTMVDTYVQATGGAKPLCFTELGYLAGAEYPDLAQTAPGFAWAANTTVTQQAQWLAEVTGLAKASNGQIRLLIVFNVDLQTGGADPQSGYAIVRPDGSCPACETLAAVMSQP